MIPFHLRVYALPSSASGVNEFGFSHLSQEAIVTKDTSDPYFEHRQGVLCLYKCDGKKRCQCKGGSIGSLSLKYSVKICLRNIDHHLHLSFVIQDDMFSILKLYNSVSQL